MNESQDRREPDIQASYCLTFTLEELAEAFYRRAWLNGPKKRVWQTLQDNARNLYLAEALETLRCLEAVQQPSKNILTCALPDCTRIATYSVVPPEDRWAQVGLMPCCDDPAHLRAVRALARGDSDALSSTQPRPRPPTLPKTL